MYILVGNQGHAALFRRTRDNQLSLTKVFENTKFTKKESNIYTHRAGTGVTSYTSDQTTLGESNYKQELVKKFCKKLVDKLEKLIPQNAKLILIGGPSFLGELRKKYTVPLEKRITNEVVKNFYTDNPHELNQFFENSLGTPVTAF